MTVSSRTGNSAGLASLPASTSSIADTDASLLRSFAVLLCSKCLYSEFPGCDVHGSLYTQQLTDTEGKLHAKCPRCSAGTNTARPFRDGCRRCKASTTVNMWVCSLQEIQQTMKAFPVMTETIEHTVLISLEPLTTASGNYLKVANFQLGMPHVDGCLRRGMPLQPVAVQFPKSELKFIVERIENCPLAMKLTDKPQYRSRKLEIVTKQNHLHQVAIRLLSTVIGAFDPDSAAAVGPLRQVVAILEKIEPLVLFSEWSPPRQLSHKKYPQTKLPQVPCLIWSMQHPGLSSCINFAADERDKTNWWWSAIKKDDDVPQSNEWIVCQFSFPITLSSIELKWHPDYLPEQFSLGISRYSMSYDTVAVVMASTTESRILVPEGTLVTSIKITMMPVNASGKSFGLVSITCNEASFSSVHTSTGLVLRNIQRWLHDAAVSSLPEVRDLALSALQKLCVASGSLCGLLQLATCLVLNTRERVGPTIVTASMNRKSWNQLDLLSEDGQSSAQVFVQELAASVQRIVLGAHSQVNLQDKHVIEQLFLLQEVAIHAAESKLSNKNVSCSTGLFTLLVGRQDVLESIKRRSQLGLIILHMISELSAWQMKRMQKIEEFTGKQELELMQLEEPFAMEICPEFFAISHRLLISVLSGLHQQRQDKTDSCTQKGEEDDDVAMNANDGGNDNDGESFQDLYDDLASSFGHFRADVEKQEGQSDSLPRHSRKGYTGHSKFSPEGLCVAVLEIVTSNLRCLVLSKIDPIEIGITPAQAHNENDLLSAPPALNPTVSLLEQLISLGTKRSDALFPVSLKAAAAMEVGSETFYPSAHQRTKMLASRMGKGATLEVQVRWPVQERGQEDPRYERLILMLQLECIKLGIRQAVRGTWYFFMHLVVEVPSVRATEEVLTQHFAPCIQRAGFSSWQVTAGAQELSIKLQRHLHWNRVEKMLQDSGAGWIRVYPADVASYDEVLADVEGFLAEHATYGQG